MALIIADSGSTKTDWSLCLDGKKVAAASTIGFNPYFQKGQEISNIIKQEVFPVFKDYLKPDSQVHYYGTGCSTEKNCSLIRVSLQEGLGISTINVSHDLLAAARALLGRGKGIAAILGTGSNSGLYDGETIIENVPSTGYLWSDYGGGSQIGKFIIREYFEGRMPEDLRTAFEAEGYNREVILENTYKSALPSRYLASVSLFAARHTLHPLIQKILRECFDSFFELQVNKYSNSRSYTVNTIGSVGYFYQDLLREVGKKHGYRLGKMVKSPMEGLISFHHS